MIHWLPMYISCLQSKKKQTTNITILNTCVANGQNKCRCVVVYQQTEVTTWGSACSHKPVKIQWFTKAADGKIINEMTKVSTAKQASIRFSLKNLKSSILLSSKLKNAKNHWDTVSFTAKSVHVGTVLVFRQIRSHTSGYMGRPHPFGRKWKG